MMESIVCRACSGLFNLRATRTFASASNTEFDFGAFDSTLSASSVLPSDSNTSALPASASAKAESFSNAMLYEARALSKSAFNRCAVPSVAWGCAFCGCS